MVFQMLVPDCKKWLAYSTLLGNELFLALLRRVEGEPKPAPVKRPPRRAKRRLPRLAPLYVTADAVRWCIYSTPPPKLRVHMSKTLTATYFYENFVPLLLLERLADVLRPPA
jgi:hypothetical protein